VVSCHNDIIAVHRRILELWHNPVLHTFGPQVDRIITKSLKLHPLLASPTTENVVDFYDRLQESTTGLIIAHIRRRQGLRAAIRLFVVGGRPLRVFNPQGSE
jgi:DNA-binding FadR family transcriptional regulator